MFRIYRWKYYRNIIALARALTSLLLDEEEENINDREGRKCWVLLGLQTASILVGTTKFFNSWKKLRKCSKNFYKLSQFKFLVENLSCNITKEGTQKQGCIRMK